MPGRRIESDFLRRVGRPNLASATYHLLMRFAKYHALGNDYLVLDPGTVDGELSPQQIRLICDRHYGVGSDGLLLGPLPSGDCDFALRLFNPDGGEFEKSGNGLRIFARYLWDEGRVGAQPSRSGRQAGLSLRRFATRGAR